MRLDLAKHELQLTMDIEFVDSSFAFADGAVALELLREVALAAHKCDELLLEGGKEPLAYSLKGHSARSGAFFFGLSYDRARVCWREVLQVYGGLCGRPPFADGRGEKADDYERRFIFEGFGHDIPNPKPGGSHMRAEVAVTNHNACASWALRFGAAGEIYPFTELQSPKEAYTSALVEKAARQALPAHIVFCLDESGSMSGERWRGAIAAFQTFWTKTAAGGGDSTFVSVVNFHHAARLVFELKPCVGAPPPIDYQSGATRFGPPLEIAASIFARNGPAQGYVPVVIFMSDGDSDDWPKGREKMRELANTYADFQSHSVAFGGGAPTTLKEMALLGGSEEPNHFHTALTGDELVAVFGTLAESV